jgi:hypothetical protein
MAPTGVAHPGVRFGKGLSWGTDVGHATVIKVCDAIRKVVNALIMGYDDHHSLGSGCEFADETHDFLASGTVEGARGLVAHEDSRTRNKRARNGYALLLTARQFAWPRRFATLQANFLQ